MLTNTFISVAAQKIISDYNNLPFSETLGVRCPYFNNAKTGHRGQLKVLAGKGSPQEIVEEAKIISIQYKQPIVGNTTLTIDDIRKFLIDNNLGIDCSGFISNVLRAHYTALGVNFFKHIFITSKTHILRWLISRLRPTEHISVKVYAHEKNSHVIPLSDIAAGDLIVMLGTGPQKKRDHILLVTATEQNTISYAHARAWSSEGRYGHGVSEGTIILTDHSQSLLNQQWKEKNMLNEQNETYLEAQQATILEIRRLNVWK